MNMRAPAIRYIRSRPPGLFDHDVRLGDFFRRGDILHRLDAVVDWYFLVSPIQKALPKPVVAPGGRPAWHRKVLFELLVVQRPYQFWDESAEFQWAHGLLFPHCVDSRSPTRFPSRTRSGASARNSADSASSTGSSRGSTRRFEAAGSSLRTGTSPKPRSSWSPNRATASRRMPRLRKPGTQRIGRTMPRCGATAIWMRGGPRKTCSPSTASSTT